MENELNKSRQEKTDRQQKSTHLNDPTHRDLNAHGIQEQQGQFDADLDTFDDLSLQNRNVDENQQNLSHKTSNSEGSKMGRGQIPQEKNSSPNTNKK